MTRALRGDESLNGLTRPDLFRIPVEYAPEVTASLTLDRTRLGRITPATSGSAIVLTVPADTSAVSYIDGEAFYAYQYGAGLLSFAAAGGVTIRTPSTLDALAQYAIIGVVRLPTANEWLAFGALAT